MAASALGLPAALRAQIHADPAAQWTGALRNAAFFAYANNYLIDVKLGIIMDVEASLAIRQAEEGASQTMIERTEAIFGLKPDGLVVEVPQQIDNISGLVFLGGTMSVNDRHPWLAEEMRLIRVAATQGLPMLGHCLGSQLITKALGGTVAPMPNEEIGWHEV